MESKTQPELSKITLLVCILSAPLTWIKNIKNQKIMQTIGVISLIIFVVVGSVFFIFATNYTGKHAIMGPLEITITPRFFYLVGWIYFLFEGILNVLPVMNESNIQAH